jgi:hypothetical protein
VLNLPTAYWQEWARDLAARGEVVPEAVRLVVAGGEKASAEAYLRWLEVGGRRARRARVTTEPRHWGRHPGPPVDGCRSRCPRS